MTIHLGLGWTLDSDGRQWILGEDTVSINKTTKAEYESNKTVGYYHDLASVAKAIGRKTAQRSVAGGASLGDVIVALEATIERIQHAMQSNINGPCSPQN